MPVPNEQEMRAAMRIAKAAAALTEAAQDFKAAVIAVADTEDARKSLELAVLDSRTREGLNFCLSTAHTPVEAIFDHAFKDDKLVGRYRFFAVQQAATGSVEATEIWTVLIDANCQATWEPNEPFAWHFTPHHHETATMMGHFVLTLLGKIQAKLTRY
jgi:hypothetical protein